jgi:hypothetical protein
MTSPEAHLQPRREQHRADEDDTMATTPRLHTSEGRRCEAALPQQLEW